MGKPYMYRDRSKEWQEKAAALPAGDERNVCEQVAAGYADLAQLLEKRAARLHAGHALPTG